MAPPRTISHCLLRSIQSMTSREREQPEIINGGRRRRIAKGSGSTVQQVNRLLKDFLMMRKMMSKMTRLGPKKLMRMRGLQ